MSHDTLRIVLNNALPWASLCYSPAASQSLHFEWTAWLRNTTPSAIIPPAGTMDLSGHVRTWLAFWSGGKWAVIMLVILATLLFIFRTHNG